MINVIDVPFFAVIVEGFLVATKGNGVKERDASARAPLNGTGPQTPRRKNNQVSHNGQSSRCHGDARDLGRKRSSIREQDEENHGK